MLQISEEEAKGMMPDPQTPQNGAVRNNGGMCALAVVFNIVGILSILAGLIVGLASYKTYDSYGYGIVMSRNYVALWMCIFGGVTVAMFNFALAVIVDACQKYRKAHKG